MPSKKPIDSIPPEAFLHEYPPSIMAIGQRLRWVVKRAAPGSIERVRGGWRIIGYDLPGVRSGAYFAWVFPELEHVHLGFPKGSLMGDPDGVLDGAGVTKLARWITYEPGDSIDEPLALRLLEEAIRVARMSKEERAAARFAAESPLFDMDSGPPR
jgi:hypothetical protein